MTKNKLRKSIWSYFFEEIGVLEHQNAIHTKSDFKVVHPDFWIPSWNSSIELVKKIPNKTDFLNIIKKDRPANTIIISGIPIHDKYSVRLILKEKGIYDFLTGEFFMCKECPALFFGVHDKGSSHVWASSYLGHPYAKLDCKSCRETPVLSCKLQEIYDAVSGMKVR